MEKMEGSAEERLQSVLADIGTRLDKIVGPFRARKGNKKVAVLCPWHTENTPSLILKFNSGEAGPTAHCLSCGVKGDVLFTADDGDGTDSYAMVRRWAKYADEVDSIVALGR
jgi:hypothetical protein